MNIQIMRLFTSLGKHKMIEGWKSYYKTAPEITGDIDYYKIIFNLDTKKDSGGKQGSSQKTTQKIIKEIQKNPSVSRTELADLVGITADGIKYHLSKMKKNRVLRHVGPAKADIGK